MKGTLYSSDFVKNSQGDIKILELNTDTDFPSASIVSHFDWSPLQELLTSESISTVHVVHKDFQNSIVSNLSESLHNSSYSGTFETTKETVDTIYPTDIADSSDKFILRLAYNEAAIFDSEYCKTETPLYKLFTDSSGSDSYVINHYISSSAEGYNYNNLNEVFNSSSIPDLAVKSQITDGPKLNFYKIGNSSDTDSNRYSSFISSSYEDGLVITNYVDTSDGTDYMHSYRACNILYGTDLQTMNIGMYKIKSWVDRPTSISYDDTQVVNLIDNKHRYEFATNWPKEYWKNQGGVFSEAELIDESGSIVLAKNTVENERYQSLDISGLPDSDNVDEVFSWSHSGSSLPEGTSVTSSVLVTKDSASIQYGVLTEISSSNNSSVLVGSGLPILVYDVNEDCIKFEHSYNITSDGYQLIDTTGSLVNIVENNLLIFEGEEFTYELNMESDDTFTINNSGVLLTSHNPFYGGDTCFLAGAQIQTLGGDKNIEDIIVGDIVQGWDSENNRFVTSSVTAIDHRHTVGDHLTGCQQAGYGECGVFKLIGDFGDGQSPQDLGFQFTPEHPFLTKEGWKSISPLVNQEPWLSQQEEVLTLQSGDFVKFDDSTTEGKWIEIVEIQFEPKEASTPVYNFTVEGISNYCVSYIVAHNK